MTTTRRPADPGDNGYYPLAEGEKPPATPAGAEPKLWRARYAGAYRPPKAGEWFLSGAIVEAYKAHADMTSAYFIAELVPGHLTWVPDTRT